MDYFGAFFEVAHHDLSVVTFNGVHISLGINAILFTGSEEMKKRIIPAAVNYEKIFCFALTEPTGGSDVSKMMRTTAKSGARPARASPAGRRCAVTSALCSRPPGR